MAHAFDPRDPPLGWLGWVTAVNLVVGRSQSAVLRVSHFEVFEHALTFVLQVFLRDAREYADVDLVLGSASRPYPETKRASLAVELPDGTELSDRRNAGQARSELALEPQRSGTTASHLEFVYLVPVRPATVTFIAEWASQGIVLTRTPLKAGLLAAAALRAEELW